MLDTSIKFNNEVTFNSVAGTLVKSCEGSKFIRILMTSSQADMFFYPECPHRTKNSLGGIGVKISVLQVMLCANDILLVEYVDID